MESIKTIFKIGKGPSSSHTMGPKKAAAEFRATYPNAESFVATLYGSLAATGKGHFTDTAIIEALQPHAVQFIWQPNIILDLHTNAMKFEAYDDAKALLGSKIYYSVGGGKIVDEKLKNFSFNN